MHPIPPDERLEAEDGSRIVAALYRIADDARERGREAYETAIGRHRRVPEISAESDTLPRVA